MEPNAACRGDRVSVNMSDPKSTIYAAEPHTTAKHRILRAYLERWLPILDRQSQRINRSQHRLLYVDGFAGAGEYENGIVGSPLIPIETAMGHEHQFACPIEIRLIEKRADRVQHLSRLIKEKKAKLVGPTNLVIPDPVEGDCEQEVRKLVADCEQKGTPLGPAFFFLDQFGYSSFSMDLVQTVLRHDVCEVFSYLNWNLLHPFMSDSTKHAGITKAFGGDEWRDVLGLSGQEKENRFRQTYIDALQKRGSAKYAYPFAMRDTSHRVIYWLFFCTNNIRGLEEMKKAMWSVDRSGGFEFSDKFASERSSLFEYGDVDLARDLIAELAGQTMTVLELREHALKNTPACKYFEAFGLMEREGQLKPVSPPPGRRAGSFSDYPDMRVELRLATKVTQGSLFGR